MVEYFEDIAVGETHSFGSYTVSEAEMTEFASSYDPQPIHLDPEAAAKSMFGGLIASGWHTGAMTMRMVVENLLADSGAAGAIGMDELRFPNPVRPGDILSVETEVLETEPWDEDHGLVRVHTQTVTEDDAVVLSMVALVLWKRRAED
jgi:acyl dehydratase